jgi:hypothetical protein
LWVVTVAIVTIAKAGVEDVFIVEELVMFLEPRVGLVESYWI